MGSAALPSWASDSGSQPIRVVVPFAAGGSTDALARLFALHLGKHLKAVTLVENAPGASGTLGVQKVMRAPADGRTLLLGITGSQLIAPALLPTATYTSEKDFIPIGRIAQTGVLVLANGQFAGSTVADMVAESKKSKVPLAYGTWGSGSGGHLVMESVRQHTGMALDQVPYKGEAPVMQAMLGGELAWGTAAASMALLQHVQSGKIKGLGISGGKRWSRLPEVKTFEEQGIPQVPASWFGVFVTKGTAPSVVQRLRQAFDAVYVDPQVHQSLRSLGLDPDPISTAAFTEQIRREADIWRTLVVSSGAKAV
ncbi:tripartite tricarboxylate transporter substrate binding protein [Comamonas serinivorans]|nr:tripartite tricarboxylate transporter substrate binding protein [Comamonas serinivorans]